MLVVLVLNVIEGGGLNKTISELFFGEWKSPFEQLEVLSGNRLKEKIRAMLAYKMRSVPYSSGTNQGFA